jgi:MSHA biogenesis protein MshP
MNALASMHARPRRSARGFGSLVIIGVLVLMAALSAATLRFSQQSSTTSQQGSQGLLAASAARAGIEFGLYEAFRGGWSACSSNSTTLDLTTDTGMHVTVYCDSAVFNEGETSPGVPAVLRVFTIDAVACNSSTCPDATAVTRQGYVERKRRVQAIN